MALPRDYTGQACSLARSLEIVGERWTLVILRDAFYGVRRFTDFASHLDIPRAVLAERLTALVEHGLMLRGPAPGGGRGQYTLTEKGKALWPVVRSLVAWGDEYYAPEGPRRRFLHAACRTELEADGRCRRCETLPAVEDVVIVPGPGMEPPTEGDAIGGLLLDPHRLLEPLVPTAAS